LSDAVITSTLLSWPFLGYSKHWQILDQPRSKDRNVSADNIMAILRREIGSWGQPLGGRRVPVIVKASQSHVVVAAHELGRAGTLGPGAGQDRDGVAGDDQLALDGVATKARCRRGRFPDVETGPASSPSSAAHRAAIPDRTSNSDGPRRQGADSGGRCATAEPSTGRLTPEAKPKAVIGISANGYAAGKRKRQGSQNQMSPPQTLSMGTGVKHRRVIQDCCILARTGRAGYVYQAARQKGSDPWIRNHPISTTASACG